jgi:tRNA (guanine6-N2)-methyltransferase
MYIKVSKRYTSLEKCLQVFLKTNRLSNKMPKFIIQCTKGLERVAINELNQEAKIISEGLLELDFEGDYTFLANLRTADDAIVHSKTFSGITRYRASLRNLRHQAAKANLRKAADMIQSLRHVDNTFAVKASYEGRRDYTAEEVEKNVAEGITSHYGWKLGTDAELHIPVILKPDIAFIGISISKKPLHVLNSLPCTLPGSLRASVAFSLLKIADIEKHDVLLDPMAGAGTIAILGSISGANAIAGDIDESRIKIARQNAAAKLAKVDFHVWNAKDTKLPPDSIDKIVCNLPFGKQVHTEMDISGFLDEMIRVAKKGARLVFLTRHGNILEAAKTKGLKILENFDIINSGLKSHIIVFERW